MFAEYQHRPRFAKVLRVQQNGRHSMLEMGNAAARSEVDDDTIVDNVAAESDYGSDLDASDLDELLSQSLSQPAAQSLPVNTDDVDEPVIPQRDESDELQTGSVLLSRADAEALVARLDQIDAQSARTREEAARIREVLLRGDGGVHELDSARSQSGLATASSEQVHYSEIECATTTEHVGDTSIKREASPIEQPDANDTRSPIERFRKHRALTVTDLVTPAWCELQYWYNLNRYGKIQRTSAMKQGSKIHKQIEEETQVEVRVETTTKEDQFGVNLWNIIQGLRGLRATGLTRELSVYGLVDGNVVVGKIDALSYTCPDEKFEAEMLDMQNTAKNDSGKTKEEIAPDQTMVTDFFRGSQEQATILNSQAAWSATPLRRRPAKTIYLSDVKTRGSRSVPSGKMLKSTQMQLMLYRRFLSDLAANEVEAQRVFDLYKLDADAPFSDTFIASMGNINPGSSQQSQFGLELDDSNDEIIPLDDHSSYEPFEEIIKFNTLASLWSHMIAEFQHTIPIAQSTSCISPILTAEFRDASRGSLIGKRSFAYDAQALEEYVRSEMAWWRGQREAQGVQDIEEAVYKCRSCKFAEICTWRKDLDEKHGQKGKLLLKRASSVQAQSQPKTPVPVKGQA